MVLSRQLQERCRADPWLSNDAACQKWKTDHSFMRICRPSSTRLQPLFCYTLHRDKQTFTPIIPWKVYCVLCKNKRRGDALCPKKRTVRIKKQMKKQPRIICAWKRKKNSLTGFKGRFKNPFSGFFSSRARWTSGGLVPTGQQCPFNQTDLALSSLSCALRPCLANAIWSIERRLPTGRLPGKATFGE